MSLPTGQRKNTISAGTSVPYGDQAEGLLQDNAFKLDFNGVAVPDFGHSAGSPQRATQPVTPPGGNVSLSGQQKTKFVGGSANPIPD